MFDYFKKIVITSRADDELLYEFVLNEMENGVVAKGLWGKALANSGGDNANAKSIYMKYRVQSIKDIFTAQKLAYKELTKPKLFQYIEDKILPMTNDYSSLMAKTNVVEHESYIVSKDEEALYEQVAEELAKDIRKEGLWLKALQNTDGDENRTLALYIKYRSGVLEAEKVEKDKQRLITLALEKLALEQQELEKQEFEKQVALSEFLTKHNLRIIEKIHTGYIRIAYNDNKNNYIRNFFGITWIKYSNNEWMFD